MGSIVFDYKGLNLTLLPEKAVGASPEPGTAGVETVEGQVTVLAGVPNAAGPAALGPDPSGSNNTILPRIVALPAGGLVVVVLKPLTELMSGWLKAPPPTVANCCARIAPSEFF